MARLALILVTGCAPWASGVGLSSGVGYAHRAGAYRDDTIATAHASVQVRRDLAIDASASEDADRLENALGFGARYRPLVPPCWAPYLRGQLSLVNASHVVSNVDVLAGAGYWGHVWKYVGWFAEADAVARFGEPNAASLRLELGLEFETSAFWR